MIDNLISTSSFFSIHAGRFGFGSAESRPVPGGVVRFCGPPGLISVTIMSSSEGESEFSHCLEAIHQNTGFGTLLLCKFYRSGLQLVKVWWTVFHRKKVFTFCVTWCNLWWWVDVGIIVPGRDPISQGWRLLRDFSKNTTRRDTVVTPNITTRKFWKNKTHKARMAKKACKMCPHLA